MSLFLDDNNYIHRSHLERESTELSDDFEKHTPIPRNSSFDREQEEQFSDDDSDMSDSNMEKAATRIQASYRGYKTRKELSSTSVPNPIHGQHYSQTHENYKNSMLSIPALLFYCFDALVLSPSAEGNKVLAGDKEDDKAAVKIQVGSMKMIDD